MTMAVCYKCGCTKFGALTQCPDCGFAPETASAQQKTMALTDWCQGWDDLDRISQELIAQNLHVKRAPPPAPSESSFNLKDYDVDDEDIP